MEIPFKKLSDKRTTSQGQVVLRGVCIGGVLIQCGITSLSSLASQIQLDHYPFCTHFIEEKEHKM